MIVTDIHLYSSLDDGVTSFKHAEMSLRNPKPTHSYIITNLTGLDADEIISAYYNSSAGNLEGNYSITPASRDVGIRLKLNPQYGNAETTESLRDRMAKMISYTRNGKIEIRFMNGVIHVASLFGFVTKFESDVMVKEPFVEMTFTCRDRFLRSPNYVDVSSPSGASPSWVDDESTAPHGFQMGITFTGTVSSPLIIHGVYGSTLADLTIQDSFANGHQLFLSSEPGNRYLYKVVLGVTTHLVDKLTDDSIWPMMFPGETRIQLSTASVAWSQLRYRPTYWGL